MTTKHELFCQEYATHGNAAQAAIACGYSEKCARSSASRLLTKPHIKERVSKLNKAANKRAGLSQDRIRKFWEDTLNSDEVSDSVKATVARDAAKHMDMFVDKVEHSGNIDIANRMTKAQDRTK